MHVRRICEAVEIVSGDGEIGGDGGGAGVARRAEEVGAGILAAEGPAERVLPPSTADYEDPHFLVALRNASAAAPAAFRAASATSRARSFASVRVVGTGGGHVVPERARAGFVAPADVLAAHDAVVFAARDPALELRRAHGVHRMREGQRVDDLVDRVEPLVARGVFVRLRHEGVHVHGAFEHRAPAAAGHLHVEPLRHDDILMSQEPRPIGRELALPRPLEEREPHRQEDDTRQQRQSTEADEREHRRDGRVQGMAAHHVSQLVGQEDPELIVVQQLERRGVEHDEWIVHAVRAGVEDRGLRDVELGDVGPVERGADFDVQGPDLGELRGPHAHRVALKQEPDAPLAAQECDHLAHHVVEARHRPERLQSGPVGRVLPAHGGDLGKGAAGAGGGDAAHGRLGV